MVHRVRSLEFVILIGKVSHAMPQTLEFHSGLAHKNIIRLIELNYFLLAMERRLWPRRNRNVGDDWQNRSQKEPPPDATVRKKESQCLAIDSLIHPSEIA